MPPSGGHLPAGEQMPFEPVRGYRDTVERDSARAPVPVAPEFTPDPGSEGTPLTGCFAFVSGSILVVGVPVLTQVDRTT